LAEVTQPVAKRQQKILMKIVCLLYLDIGIGDGLIDILVLIQHIKHLQRNFSRIVFQEFLSESYVP
jgi:hypothetical protein